MKIILVVTDTKRKNLVFVSDNLKALSLEEAIDAAGSGDIEDAYRVEGKTGAYIRTKQSVPKKDELEYLSVTGRNLVRYFQGNYALSTPAISDYTKRYFASLAEGRAYIQPIGHPKFLRALTADVKEKLLAHRDIIRRVAAKFSIDQNILGALLVDEITRLLPFEDVLDSLSAQIIGRNVSVGVAQVRIETANDLIKKRVYNPNPHDKKLPFERMTNADRSYLFAYLIQTEHNISFAAAFVRYVIDFWAPHADLSNRTDIIGTLYHLGYGHPKANPKADERGAQIADDFYPLAKRWLSA